MRLIQNELITIRKCEQLKNRLLVAIDIGKVFTKVLFLNKSNTEQLFNDGEASLVLDLNSFYTEDFEHAIKWVRDNAYIPEDDKHSVHITGSCTPQNQNKIQIILNREILYIDEYLAVAIGCQFALESIGVDNLFQKSIESDSFGKIDNEFINKFMKSLNNKLMSDKNSSNDSYPSLFHIQGSRSLSYYFDENRKYTYLDVLHPGGQTFLGLSKCLFNTNNYDEIVKLGSKGNRCNVDTQCKEVIDSDIESPYGRFPPEMPLLHFGKCMDYNLGMESLKKEDVALSLISLHCNNIIMYCSSICILKHITKVFLSGSLFNSDVFQREFNSIPFQDLAPIKFKFLNFPYSGVLGAMVCDGNITKGHIDFL